MATILEGDPITQIVKLTRRAASRGKSRALTYDVLRSTLADELAKAAISSWGPSAQALDRLDAEVPRDGDARWDKLLVALAFMEAWIDAPGHDGESPAPVQPADWPRMAMSIAEDLRRDQDVSDPLTIQMFGVERVPSAAHDFTENLRRTLWVSGASFAPLMALLIVTSSRAVSFLGGLVLLGVCLSGLVATLLAFDILRARPELRTRSNLGCTVAGAIPGVAVVVFVLLVIWGMVAELMNR